LLKREDRGNYVTDPSLLTCRLHAYKELTQKAKEVFGLLFKNNEITKIMGDFTPSILYYRGCSKTSILKQQPWI
jgi:hypothetical protein